MCGRFEDLHHGVTRDKKASTASESVVEQAHDGGWEDRARVVSTSGKSETLR